MKILIILTFIFVNMINAQSIDTVFNISDDPRFYSGNSLLSEINKLSKYLNKFEGLNFPIILKKHSFFESNKILREFVGSNEEFSNEFIDSLAQQLKYIEEFKLLKLSKSKEDNYENLS